ncbi:hypothetical protein OY671_009105, partial [Metschnikowia pulcherrima]
AGSTWSGMTAGRGMETLMTSSGIAPHSDPPPLYVWPQPSIVLGKHEGEDAGRERWIGGIFRAPFECPIVIVDDEPDSVTSNNELAAIALPDGIGAEVMASGSAEDLGSGEGFTDKTAIASENGKTGCGHDDTRLRIAAKPNPVVKLCNAEQAIGHLPLSNSAVKPAIHCSIVGRSLTGTRLAASWKRIRSVGASRRIARISASGRSISVRMKSVIRPGSVLVESRQS